MNNFVHRFQHVALANIMTTTRQIAHKLHATLNRVGLIVLIICLLGATSFTALTPTASAASAPAKSAEQGKDAALLVKQSDRFLTLPPGKAVTVWFEFQNTGTSTWTKNDPRPVGLNTDDPFRRQSKFEAKTWRASWRPARLVQKTVKPGGIGRVRFAVQAPKKPGIYRERFILTRDTKTKIPGGGAEFVILVGKDRNLELVYKAQLKEKKISLWVKPGERVYRPVEFRNVGYATWKTQGFGVTNLTPVQPEGSVAASATSALTVASTPAVTKSAGIRESTTAILDVIAPATSGTYTETFGLYGPYGVISGSTFSVELTVSEQDKPPLDAEPIIRVGVYAPGKTSSTSPLFKPVGVTANGPYEIRNADTGEVLASLTASELATIQYDQKTNLYSLTTPTGTSTSSAALSFVPLAAETIMELKSTSLKNYNLFRGTIEARYAPATKKLWIINQLAAELYLRGLAETSSVAPLEFVKTLVTAARTYALYHTFRATKHANENYHINSTTDQVYRGYGYELKTPNITEGVTATRGMVVIHPSMITEKNKIGVIVAAYSSGTDGRTRSYQEVWGGPPDLFPYLVSVPDPNGIIPNATTLPGNHMVGLSATGALRTTVNEGLTYDTVLRYYYTGTSVIKAYL